MEIKTIWAVITNSDRTEGKGIQIYKSLHESQSDAIDAAKGAGVQGIDAEVSPCNAILDKEITGSGSWYGPVNIIPASKQSIFRDQILADREEAYNKAKSLGMTDQEIARLKNHQ